MFGSIHILGILFAFSAAIAWGSADFSGGLATRRINQFQVLALSAISGLVVLSTFALIWRETFLTPRGIVLSTLGGVTGAVGMTALYKGLSSGRSASVAPTAAVIGAALPVGYSVLFESTPTTLQFFGFLLAFLGIWLVSQSSAARDAGSRQAFMLACVAGIGFGSFFILISLADPGKIILPFMVARIAVLCIALILMRLYRLPMPSLTAYPSGLLAGALDAIGNIFFLLARQYTRLDIAVLLSSMYPAMTVLLANRFAKEHVSRNQQAGVAICLIATMLISL